MKEVKEEAKIELEEVKKNKKVDEIPSSYDEPLVSNQSKNDESDDLQSSNESSDDSSDSEED